MFNNKQKSIENYLGGYILYSSLANSKKRRLTKYYFSFNGSTVQNAPTSNSAHYKASLGIWSNVPVIVGGSDLRSFINGVTGVATTQWDYNKKVEHFENGVWTLKDDFPFVDSAIKEYSVASFNNSMYIFGKFTIGGYSQFWFTKIYYNLFIHMFFDAAVSR